MDLRIVEKADLERVADKIRSHTGSEEAIQFPDGFEAGVDEAVNKYYEQLISVIEKRGNAIQELPSDLTVIGQYTFRGNDSLMITTIPSGVQEMFNQCFAYCNNLTEISLPESLKRMYNQAFYNCANLNRVTFGGTPNTISTNAFESCPNLTTINVPWSEGEVAGAPWGALNATINYNYTGGN